MTEKGKQKTLIGVVVSDKMQKTVVVEVQRTVKDKKFQKYLTRTKRFQAHDENQECNVGDRVLIEETRPLSRHKRWQVSQILEKAQA